jgi:hypothetical protein
MSPFERQLPLHWSMRSLVACYCNPHAGRWPGLRQNHVVVATGGGTLSPGEWAGIQIDGGQATEANKPLDRSSHETPIVWDLGEESPGGTRIEASYAGDTGVTAEGQYAHIPALRFKEPSSSLGSEEAQ